MKTKCILFDRDGTLGSLEDERFPQSFSPFCSVKEVFDKLQERGYIVGILSNQSSIARGTGRGYDFDGEFTAYGAELWEICPHDDQDNCNCRKPKSGMLLSAAKRLGLSPAECLVVGDRLSDVQCAKNVDAKAALVLTGKGNREREEVLQRYPDTPVLERFDRIFEIL